MKRGGKRVGAGRKPKHEKPMKQKTIRLPSEWIASLVAEFGTLQNAVENLTSKHLNLQ